MSLAGAARVLLAELASLGLEPDAVCRAAGVDGRALVADPSALDARRLARILRRAEEMAAEPLLGLRLAERARGRGVLSYLARSQRTVGEALDAFARFATRSWGLPDAVRIEHGPRTVAVRFHLGDDASRHAVEYLVARTAISLASEGVRLEAVDFRHPPGGALREYERVLRCPVRFRRKETQVLLLACDLARPLRASNPEAAALLGAALEQAAPRSRTARTAAERLAAAYGAALERGERVDRETLARSLGMSGKTLARRLASEGRRYRDVVDGVRRALVERLVAQGEPLALTEVAVRAGFADLPALGKACRRWFGASPSELRARRRAAG